MFFMDDFRLSNGALLFRSEGFFDINLSSLETTDAGMLIMIIFGNELSLSLFIWGKIVPSGFPWLPPLMEKKLFLKLELLSIVCSFLANTFCHATPEPYVIDPPAEKIRV